MMQLIAADTLSFEMNPNAELPPHIKALSIHGMSTEGIMNNLYTEYTLKFGVIGKKQREEMNKRFEKLYGELSELKNGI